ncbi:isopentenyl-diphosphate Delta-isomerase [Microbacterium murale]|nr:isopentenyl-diphosphate Delta-isomerase [Microbacterium murale]
MVVLVDDAGTPIGAQSKATAHGSATPRHLAFSCHVVDADGRVLVTRRALTKQTWPGVWTNSFCGHPAPDESLEDAVRRRAAFELGLAVDMIECVAPKFGYVARDASGIQENEHCPVFIARAASPLSPNPDEVAETQWTTASALALATGIAPWAFSPWLVEHLPQVLPHLPGDAERHVDGVDEHG